LIVNKHTRMRQNHYFIFNFNGLQWNASPIRHQYHYPRSNQRSWMYILPIRDFYLLRLTTAQRDAIATPAAGLMIYNTTVNCLQWWNGTSWYDGCGNNFVCGTSTVTFTYNGSTVTYGTVGT
jgi:hypothetical protein